MEKAVMLAIAFLLTGLLSAQAAEQTPVSFEELQQGKQLFEENCIECHDLTWPKQKVTDRAGWEETLTKMAGKGARMGQEERQMVIEYLLAKSTFQANCRACHDEKKAMGKNVSPAEYEKMVRRCADQKPGMLTEQEVKNVSGYLILGD
jgi:mono/diheme cytochrome c family protein